MNENQAQKDTEDSDETPAGVLIYSLAMIVLIAAMFFLFFRAVDENFIKDKTPASKERIVSVIESTVTRYGENHPVTTHLRVFLVENPKPTNYQLTLEEMEIVAMLDAEEEKKANNKIDAFLSGTSITSLN